MGFRNMCAISINLNAHVSFSVSAQEPIVSGISLFHSHLSGRAGTALDWHTRKRAFLDPPFLTPLNVAGCGRLQL